MAELGAVSILNPVGFVHFEPSVHCIPSEKTERT